MCKEEICRALSERHPEGNWATERTIPANIHKRIPELRPDVSGRISDQRIAIEVQASTLTPTKIIKRSVAYAKRGIALLWVVPLREPLGVEPLRPRLYESYLHSLYFGRTYYWWPGCRHTLVPVHYGSASRHVEYREWFEDGMQQSGGGYDAEYKIIKTPIHGPGLLIDADFGVHCRIEFTPENERKKVPSCIYGRTHIRNGGQVNAQHLDYLLFRKLPFPTSTSSGLASSISLCLRPRTARPVEPPQRTDLGFCLCPTTARMVTRWSASFTSYSTCCPSRLMRRTPSP